MPRHAESRAITSHMTTPNAKQSAGKPISALPSSTSGAAMVLVNLVLSFAVCKQQHEIGHSQY